MAINLFARYGGTSQADPPTAGYTYGKPRDETTVGGGDGTPWEEPMVSDLQGWMQALLVAAGMTPTDNPDRDDDSQYLQAITNICGRQLDVTTSALVTSLTEVQGFTTMGYTTAGDGGGARWYRTGNTGTPGTTDLPNGLLYDADGDEFAIAERRINVRMLGARGNGAIDDADALNAAATLQNSRGGGIVYLPAGTYLCDSQVTTLNNVGWEGDPGGGSVISFNGATGLFPDSACIFGTGSTTSLPSMTTDLDPGDMQITFALAHGLVVNDLFYIVDPRNNSYGHPTTYVHAGEFFVVDDEVSSTVVGLHHAAYATTNPVVNGTEVTYDAAQCDLLKVNPIETAFRNLKIIGISDASGNPPIRLILGRNCSLERMSFEQSANGGIFVSRCYDTTIDGVEIPIGDAAVNGLVCTNCQSLSINNVTGGGTVAAVIISAEFGAVGPVGREILISNVNVTASTTSHASVWVTQNAEYVQVSDSVLNGIVMGGDRHIINDCYIYSRDGASCIEFRELTGTTVKVTGCTLKANADFGVSAAGLRWSQTGNEVDRGGTIELSDCTFDSNGFDGDLVTATARAITTNPSLVFDSCLFLGNNTAGAEVVVASAANAGWKNVAFRNCEMRDVDLELYGAETLDISGCVSRGGPSDAILVSNTPTPTAFTPRFVNISNTQVFEANDAGIKIVDRDSTVRCDSVVSLRNDQGGTGTVQESSFVFDPSGTGTTFLYLTNCVFGDDAPTPTQSFAYGYGMTNAINKAYDIRTAIHGATLPVDRTSTLVSEIVDLYDEAGSVVTSTARHSVAGGEPGDAIAGADDLTVGDGTGSRGMTIYGQAAGTSTFAMGDPTDNDRFLIQGDHANDELDVFVAGVLSHVSTASELRPGSDGAVDLGLTGTRWLDVFSKRLRTERLFFDAGTAPVAGDFAFSAGWGAAPAPVINTVRGRQSLVEFTWTCGGTPGANPTFTYTWPDGASPNSGTPMIFAQACPAGGPLTSGQWHVTGSTTTFCTVTFSGTPVAAAGYGVYLFVVWPDG